MRRRYLCLALSLLGVASPAKAELVFFSNGRSLSVKAHRSEGNTLVLLLRSGGEVVCTPALITNITPDEIAYPEPEPLYLAVLVQPDVVDPSAPSSEERLADRPYGDVIDRAAALEGVDPKLVHAVIRVESAYHANARSPKGAMGLMQLMPATVREYAVANPYDPVTNIEAGIKHLKSLLLRFPRDLALAAYNAGEAAVQRFHGMPPYPETRSYVSRVLKLMARS